MLAVTFALQNILINLNIREFVLNVLNNQRIALSPILFRLSFRLGRRSVCAKVFFTAVALATPATVAEFGLFVVWLACCKGLRRDRL